MTLKVKVLQKPVTFELDGVHVQLNSRRADALLLYLCLGTAQVHQRDSLACLLWQDADASHSRGSLRQLIRRIRMKCPGIDEVLTVEREQILVDHSRVHLDITALQEALQTPGRGTKLSVLQFDLDDLLADFVGLSTSLDSWVAVTRNRLENNLREALTQVVHATTYATEMRVMAAQSLLNIDPTHEPSCRFLMRSYAESGNPGAAIKVYDDLHARLDQDYDTEPADETADLVAEIKLGHVKPVPAAEIPVAVAQVETTPEIFVRDFEFGVQSGRVNELARVFRYELLANLSTFREWRLYDYEPAQQRGYRLEGLLSDGGEDVIFIATLKQEADNRIIWSERFQIGFANWTKVQHRIAQQLSVAVNAGVGSDRLNKCLTNGIEDRTVFDKWVLVQTNLQEWRPDKTDHALHLLQEITDEAPRFSPAHSWFSATENIRHIMYPGILRSQSRLQTSLTHARLAMEIDPLDSRAHLAAAWGCAMIGQYDNSQLHFDRTCDLNPNSILTRMSCALGYAFLDDLPRALAIAEETSQVARSLSPFLWGYLLNIYFLDGQLDKAAEAGKLAGSSIVNLPGWHAAALYEMGDLPGARAAASDFARAVRDNWCVDTPATQEAMIAWLSDCFPLKNPEQSARLQAGLSGALTA